MAKQERTAAATLAALVKSRRQVRAMLDGQGSAADVAGDPDGDGA